MQRCSVSFNYWCQIATDHQPLRRTHCFVALKRTVRGQARTRALLTVGTRTDNARDRITMIASHTTASIPLGHMHYASPPYPPMFNPFSSKSTPFHAKFSQVLHSSPHGLCTKIFQGVKAHRTGKTSLSSPSGVWADPRHRK